MSTTYGVNVRTEGVKVRVRRFYKPYLMRYKSPTLGVALPPVVAIGHPPRPIDERLDDDSYLYVRMIVSDRENFDLSGVVFALHLRTYRRAQSAAASHFVTRISLDDLDMITTGQSMVWQIRKKFFLRDVITDYNPNLISYMYPTLRLLERDSNINPGNEWVLSLLLNCPKPEYT